MDTKVHRFEAVIRALNQRILEFNAFLSPSFQLIALNAADKASYFDEFNLPWTEQNWPSKESFGVYVICCENCSADPQQVVYVGKSSLQVMGHRMYAHLNPLRKAGAYEWNYSGNKYALRALLAIPVRPGSPGCFAAALEEYIITTGLDGVAMMNSTGRRS